MNRSAEDLAPRTASSWRPDTLAEVARRTLAGTSELDPALREFLDEFYINEATRNAAIDAEPAKVSEIADAYLAAVAEHLALVHRLEVPAWTEKPGRSLKRPFFAGGLESLKATLLVESPTAFRRRLIFVSANALARASETTAS